MRLTASKVGLLPHCQFFARAEAVWDDSSSPAADRGTRFHKAIAAYVSVGKSGALDDDIADLLPPAVDWVDAFGRERLEAEVAFAWDPATDTAERIPVVDRQYNEANGRLCGTADLIHVNERLKVGCVYDWKTGDGSKSAPQLRTLALMLARVYRLESVTIAALEVTEAGVVEVCSETLDGFAIAMFAGELADDLALVEASEPEPGPHCGEMYCPARVSCPATQASVEQLVPEGALVRRFSTEIQGPDHAAWMLERVRLVEAACKSVKDAIKKAVPEDGWPLADGTRLAMATRDMPRTDWKRLLALAKRYGATDQEIAECTYVFKESAGLRVIGGATKKRRSPMKGAA